MNSWHFICPIRGKVLLWFCLWKCPLKYKYDNRIHSEHMISSFKHCLDVQSQVKRAGIMIVDIAEIVTNVYNHAQNKRERLNKHLQSQYWYWFHWWCNNCQDSVLTAVFASSTTTACQTSSFIQPYLGNRKLHDQRHACVLTEIFRHNFPFHPCCSVVQWMQHHFYSVKSQFTVENTLGNMQM